MSGRCQFTSDETGATHQEIIEDLQDHIASSDGLVVSLRLELKELRKALENYKSHSETLKETLNQAVHDYHHVNCIKVVHKPKGGYLHGPDDDMPYDVDGCRYCGRCHIAL